MLTDYHVHLRPDGAGTPAADYFTPANVARYREAADERGIAELGASEHVYRFRQALDVWQHPFWRENAVDDIDHYAEFVREQGLKVGVEADFVPGREDRMASLLEGRDWDYVIGSVHFVGEEAVDHPDWDIWSARSVDPEKVWRRYFEWLGEAARSGLFDVLAHPDLVKVWGGERPRPEGDLRRFYELAIEGIAESGIAIEVSTAGLRKPVGERYPGRRVPRDVPRRRLPDRARQRRPPPRTCGLRVRVDDRVAGAAGRARAVRVRAARAAAGADRMTR